MLVSHSYILHNTPPHRLFTNFLQTSFTLTTCIYLVLHLLLYLILQKPLFFSASLIPPSHVSSSSKSTTFIRTTMIDLFYYSCTIHSFCMLKLSQHHSIHAASQIYFNSKLIHYHPFFSRALHRRHFSSISY